VIVGAGQVRHRPALDGPFVPREPAVLMAEAIARALADVGGANGVRDAGDGVGSAEVAGAVDHLACVDPLAWGYTDVCATTAEYAGLPAGATGLTVPPGGNSPGDLLGQLMNRIADGACQVAVLVGSEAVYARRKARSENITLDWKPFEGHRDFLKGQRPLTNALEERHGMTQPIQCYPLYETAQRAAAGRSPADHQRFLGTFMAANSAVAARNPVAWFPTAWTPDDIATPSADNRMVCYPYPKRMNAIMEVDLAAAVIVMSNVEATKRGIPADRQVALLGGASAVDAWAPSERPSLTTSPAIETAAARAFGEAGITVADVDRFDFYSCFPSAVQMGAAAVGLAIDDPRGLTVTGGLAYAGGPGNSYAMHSLAVMFELISSGQARTGLVTSLGMTATKHAVSILSNVPDVVAKAGHRHYKLVLDDAQLHGPTLSDAPTGEGTIEAYTVEYGRTGEAIRSIYVIRMDDGTRTVANGPSSDGRINTELEHVLTETECVGRRVSVVGGTPRGDGDVLGPNIATLIP
jgi:acetyl-CoA C-acetyltransferase